MALRDSTSGSTDSKGLLTFCRRGARAHMPAPGGRFDVQQTVHRHRQGSKQARKHPWTAFTQDIMRVVEAHGSNHPDSSDNCVRV